METFYQDRIEADPRICGNKPRIKGTRITVESVLGSFLDGDTVEDLIRIYRVEKEDIFACVEFAMKLVDIHWRKNLADPRDLEDED